MKKKKIKNYGLKIDTPKPEDYRFWSIISPVPFEILQPNGDWTDFLPKREAQNLNGIEPYACVSFTILNSIEALIKRKYNEEVNYSDRFLAAVSGTKEGGNSPHTVCEFLRKCGVVPEELLPFSEDIDTFDKFYAPLPPKLYELAREFNAKWEFKHEFVDDNPEAIQKALQSSPLGISVTAWFERPNGMYYQRKDMTDNHFTTLIKQEKGNFKRVFDSYDSFIKDYEFSTNHSVIKRFYIKKRDIQKSWIEKVKSY